MRKATLSVVLISALMIGFWSALGARPMFGPEAVKGVLDQLHDAAAKADGERYFSLFAPDAVFLGTDATERWPIDEFKAYAMKRFEAGTGWTYALKPGTRFVEVSHDGSYAWFDELLENAKYGVCRGSGVMRRGEGGWTIVQYNLSIMVPNDVALDVAAMVRERAKAGPEGAP
jgi:hypothetical protein